MVLVLRECARWHWIASSPISSCTPRCIPNFHQQSNIPFDACYEDEFPNIVKMMYTSMSLNSTVTYSATKLEDHQPLELDEHLVKVLCYWSPNADVLLCFRYFNCRFVGVRRSYSVRNQRDCLWYIYIDQSLLFVDSLGDRSASFIITDWLAGVCYQNHTHQLPVPSLMFTHHIVHGRSSRDITRWKHVSWDNTFVHLFCF